MLITLNTNSKTFRLVFTSSLFLFSIILFGSATYSWTGPSGTPPNSNVSTPINVSGTSQVKSGGLSVGSLLVTGSAQVNGQVYSAGNSMRIRGTSPTTYYQDTDHRSAMIHVNSNLFYILRGCGNDSTSWCTYNGVWPLYINLENNDAVFGGNVYAPGFYYSSDERLKHNISTLKGLDIVSKLRGVSFAWNNDNVASVGLIAQEVEEVLPELVTTDSETGLKSVQYGNLVAPLIEAVKEQQRQIQELKTRIEILESRF